MSNDNLTNIPIEFKSDEKGYFDRQCPNEECEYIFKIKMKDWEDNVSDEEVHCPMCGHVDTSEKWFTEQQVDYMKEIALSWATSHIQSELGKTFKKLERSTRSNKYIKIKYKPNKKVSFINNPIGQSEEWETEITCKICDTRYSVVGMAYFCPCCGYNNGVEDNFIESLDSIIKMLTSIEEIKGLLIEKHSPDYAEIMCRTMIEGSLGDVVSIFQNYAELRFTSLCDKKVRPNDFQIVEKGSRLFREELDNGYEKWISKDELEYMNLMFQRRHIIEHNGGIVDEKYIQKSNDNSYKLGQRVIVSKEGIIELIKVIKKLGIGLEMLK